MKATAFALTGITRDVPDKTKEYMSRYTNHFKTLKEAKKAALAMAKAAGKPIYVSCGNGSAIVLEDRLFQSAGYYVAQPTGSFKWDKP